MTALCVFADLRENQRLILSASVLTQRRKGAKKIEILKISEHPPTDLLATKPIRLSEWQVGYEDSGCNERRCR